MRDRPGPLRVVGTYAFVPRGPRFVGRALRAKPHVALSGGPSGIGLVFRARAAEVVIDVVSAAEPLEGAVDAAVAAGRALAGLDDDPGPFLARVRSHPIVGRLAAGPEVDPRMTRTPTLFESFAESVIGQLVTFVEARAAFRRLTRVAGELLPGLDAHAAPTAEAVRRVPMWRLREIGVGSRRAATLREGAMRGPALERLRDAAPDEAITKLQSLRGVGPWTANAVARDALGYADAVPVGDLHAPRVVTQVLTGEEEGDDEAMLAALEPFRPHRARVVALIDDALLGRRLPDTPPFRVPRVDRHRREPWRY